jgi:hypothetical protein
LSLAKYYKVETTTARQAIRAGFHRRMIHSWIGSFDLGLDGTE